jgi:hypothetical protein
MDYHGWHLPQSFLNSPWRPRPAYQGQMPNISLFGNYGVSPAGDPMQALQSQELVLNMAQGAGSVDPYRILCCASSWASSGRYFRNRCSNSR